MILSTNPNYSIFKLSGSILESNIKEIDSSLDALFAKSQKNIIVDLTDVNHICSMGLGILVAYKKKFNESSGDIKLIIYDDDLLELFEITMLDKIFNIYKDLESAERTYKT
ncbi:MAG: STAS domain-containing protein [Leptospiraceae bacterium]|nr:STAS domain-containing protein [Leptospiraceae bacterium]MCK6379790.1 STAS domain-containing protein [Leptospiraceae bacterium]NUM41355.1 STAS domain-containing protein [Leptospiraceae bacterium]